MEVNRHGIWRPPARLVFLQLSAPPFQGSYLLWEGMLLFCPKSVEPSGHQAKLWCKFILGGRNVAHVGRRSPTFLQQVVQECPIDAQAVFAMGPEAKSAVGFVSCAVCLEKT